MPLKFTLVVTFGKFLINFSSEFDYMSARFASCNMENENNKITCYHIYNYICEKSLTLPTPGFN
jgi:hypothetical protein